MTSKLKQVAVAALVAVSGAVSALPSVTTAFTSGVVNQLSDDFVEIVINGATGTPRAIGESIAVGDILLTSLAMTSYGPSGTASNTVNELSVFSAVKVKSIVNFPVGLGCLGAVLPLGGCGSFVFESTGNIAGWYAAAFGGAYAGLATTADSVAIFFEDTNHDFTTANFNSGLDGTSRMVVDLTAANGDFWNAEGPVNTGDFATQVVGEGIGSFRINGTVTAQDFAGWDIGEDITGRGNLSRAPVGAASPLGGDATFFITPNRVPEPAGLGLAALALLGMGAASRRRKV
jgi:hypothetical protein